MMAKRKWLGALLLIVVLALLVGCGGDGGGAVVEDAATNGVAEDAATNDATANDTADDTITDVTANGDRSGRDLVVGVPVEPHHFTTMWSTMSGDRDHIVLYNIYDTLLNFDADGNLQPWLVEEWEVSDDGLRIYMRLRDDVYFHNGTRLTASDVAWTLNYAVEYPLGEGLLVNYDTTEVVDDLNFIVHMTSPFAPILNAFTSRTALIMSEAWFNEVGDLEAYRENPVGTGPFRFVSYSVGDSVVLEVFEDYWGGAADFDTVTIQVITDINTLLIALEAGDVDVAVDVPVGDLARLGGRISWDAVPSNGTLAMYFNEIDADSNWVGRDLYFRKAVQYAIDRDALNTVVFGDQGMPVQVFGPPSFTTRPAQGTHYSYTHDLDRAMEFLEMSDYDGRDFDMLVMSGTASHRAAEVIQGSLFAVGINATITAVDAPTFWDIVRGTGDFDSRVEINVASLFDLDWLGNFFDRARFDHENTMFVDEEITDRLDYLINAQRETANQDERLEMITEMVDIILENALHIYMMVDVNAVAFNEDLSGVTSNMARFYRFHPWSWN